MANIEMTPHRPERPEHHRRTGAAEGVTVGGSTGEALAGLGAVILAILGLIGVLPFTLAAIATIVVGAGLLLRGSAISSRFAQLRRGLHAEGRSRVHEPSGSLTIEMLGGLACIALGILALLGISPGLLLSIAAIVFGGTFLLGANVSSRLGELEAWQTSVDPRAVDVEREAGRGSASAQMLVGIGAIVLGILALIGASPFLTLILIALLAVGGAMLLTGAMVGTRMARMVR